MIDWGLFRGLPILEKYVSHVTTASRKRSIRHINPSAELLHLKLQNLHSELGMLLVDARTSLPRWGFPKIGLPFWGSL